MVKNNKKDELINELATRRDEVVKRAALVANRQLPQPILEKIQSEADMLEWIVTPHLYETFEPVVRIDDEVLRSGTEIVGAYLRTKGEDDEEKGNETKD